MDEKPFRLHFTPKTLHFVPKLKAPLKVFSFYRI